MSFWAETAWAFLTYILFLGPHKTVGEKGAVNGAMDQGVEWYGVYKLCTYEEGWERWVSQASRGRAASTHIQQHSYVLQQRTRTPCMGCRCRRQPQGTWQAHEGQEK